MLLTSHENAPQFEAYFSMLRIAHTLKIFKEFLEGAIKKSMLTTYL